MTALLRQLAWSTSWGGRARERRRAALISVAAAAVTLVALCCVAAWLQAVRSQDRASARSFAPAQPGEPVAFDQGFTYDELSNGNQVTVVNWRFRTDTGQIPGIPGHPKPGSWFVSPSLATRIENDRDLAARYPGARVIGLPGVGTADELLAYHFVGDNVTLDSPLSSRLSGEWLGSGADLERFPIALTAIGLIAIPGLGLLLAAVSPGAVSLERRIALLEALGSSRSRRTALTLAHTMMCGAPGAALAALAVAATTSRLAVIPLVARPVLRGDLAIPVGLALAIALVIVGLAGLAAGGLANRQTASTRPTDAAVKPPGRHRGAVLAFGLMAMAGSPLSGESLRAQVFITGLLLAMVGLVRVLPLALDRVGGLLARSHHVLAILVGRRICWDCGAAPRRLAGLATLTLALPVLAAWIGVARTQDPAPRIDNPVLEWHGPALTPHELSGIQDATNLRSLELVEETTSGSRSPRAWLVADCAGLSNVVPLDQCDGQGFRIATSAAARFGDLAHLTGVARAPLNSERVATIFVAADGVALEQALRVLALNGAVSKRSVVVPSRNQITESSLVAWILAAGTLAAGLSMGALAIVALTQGARTAKTHTRLVAIGARPRRVRRLAAAEATLSILTISGVAISVGAVASWLFGLVEPAATMPWLALAAAATVAIAASALSGLGAALALSGPSVGSGPQH